MKNKAFQDFLEAFKPERKVVYGHTDRSSMSWLHQLNDALVDSTKISLKEKSIFFHSLKILVGSGISFTRAIAMMAERVRNVRLARILYTIHYDMEHNGRSFSQALQKHPQVFSVSEAKMVQAGEVTGKINYTLEAISEQIQKNLKVDAEVQKALMYPLIVSVAIIGAIGFVMAFVVPKFTSIFTDMQVELPLITQLLISLSDFVMEYWWMVLGTLFLSFLTVRSWKKSEEGSLWFDTFLLHAPMFGKLVSDIQTFRISSSLSILLESGIPLAKALHLLGEIVANRAVSDQIFIIEQKVKNGVTLSDAFSQSKYIDPVLSEVIQVGEKSGQLDEVLKKLVDQYELEIDHQFKNLTTLIEPVMLLFVGLAVVGLAFAVLMPVFELQNVFDAG